MWLATDAGIFHVTTRRRLLQPLQGASPRLAQAYTEVAAGRSGIWFAAADA